MTNVLCLAPYNFLPPKMGGQRFIAFFNEFFGEQVSLTCVSTKCNDSSLAKNYALVPLLSTGKSRYINIYYFFVLKKLIKKNGITHLLIQHPYYGWLGILLKKFCGVHFIVQSHNIESTRFKSIGKWWWGILWNYEKYVHRHADINFFITTEDREFAVANFGLDISKCHIITYGITNNNAPGNEQCQQAKKELQQLHNINSTAKILLFNGSLDYAPNIAAIDAIVQHINPILLANNNFEYKIIICGKGLPPVYDNLKAHVSKHIIFAGFVEDIDIYFKGADIFLNPVVDGGGIKTKLVEALGNNLSAVTTSHGAAGIPGAITGNKMYIADGWQDFSTAITQVNAAENIPQAFFDHFYWGNIAAKAGSLIH